MTSGTSVLATSGPDTGTSSGPNGKSHVHQTTGMTSDRDLRSSAADGVPALTCVVIAASEGVHVVTMSNAQDGRPAGTAIDVEVLASVLERAALTLRGGGTMPVSPISRATPASSRAADAVPERIRMGHLEILPATRLVLRRGEPVPLSRIEFDLFMALVRRDGQPATRLELVREVWGFGAAVTSRSVDTQVYNLRHKLEENPGNPRHLLTVSGVGYRLAP